MNDRQRSTTEAIGHILRLRRAERLADARVRAELAPVRAYLEGLVGPTVGRAQAARLLGLSQTALDRWIDKGEIAAVLTPRGRREIPLGELVALLEEAAPAGDGAPRRSVADVIGGRRRRAQELVDLDRLLPRRRRRSHRVPEMHALAYHRLIAERLDARLVDEARGRVRRWREQGRLHPRWAEEWERLLAMPLPRIAGALSADTPHARALRQTSPFAGVLTEQERRRLRQAVEERARA
jgi:hypothetical protein